MLEREDPETIVLVLDHLPEHSGERAWALLWAVQHRRSERIVRLLVERGADLEAYDGARASGPSTSPSPDRSDRSGPLMASLT